MQICPIPVDHVGTEIIPDKSPSIMPQYTTEKERSQSTGRSDTKCTSTQKKAFTN